MIFVEFILKLFWGYFVIILRVFRSPCVATWWGLEKAFKLLTENGNLRNVLGTILVRPVSIQVVELCIK